MNPEVRLFQTPGSPEVSEVENIEETKVNRGWLDSCLIAVRDSKWVRRAAFLVGFLTASEATAREKNGIDIKESRREAMSSLMHIVDFTVKHPDRQSGVTIEKAFKSATVVTDGKGTILRRQNEADKHNVTYIADVDNDGQFDQKIEIETDSKATEAELHEVEDRVLRSNDNQPSISKRASRYATSFRLDDKRVYYEDLVFGKYGTPPFAEGNQAEFELWLHAVVAETQGNKSDGVPLESEKNPLEDGLRADWLDIAMAKAGVGQTRDQIRSAALKSLGELRNARHAGGESCMMRRDTLAAKILLKAVDGKKKDIVATYGEIFR